MKEYKVFKIFNDYRFTQLELNSLASEGWVLVCSYALGNWLIMERDIHCQDEQKSVASAESNSPDNIKEMTI